MKIFPSTHFWETGLLGCGAVSSKAINGGERQSTIKSAPFRRGGLHIPDHFTNTINHFFEGCQANAFRPKGVAELDCVPHPSISLPLRFLRHFFPSISRAVAE